MSAHLPLKFYGYELRPATPEDLNLAREWTKADPHHEGRIDPRFWVEQDKGIDSYVMQDAEGGLLFLRMERATRFYIQFSPAKDNGERNRLRKAMERGMGYLAVALAVVGIREVIFDTESDTLRAFAEKNLNFRAAPKSLTRFLPFHIPRPKDAANAGSGMDDSGQATADSQPAKLQGGN